MKKTYSSPKMYAETFVPNQYAGACLNPVFKEIPVTEVVCISPGHQNTQTNDMFLDSQNACIVKFNPGVGEAENNVFYTQFEACAYVNECNRQNWLAKHPGDTKYRDHKKQHASSKNREDGAFIMHDTYIDLSLAETYQLS